jgi:hypothetical protein
MLHIPLPKDPSFPLLGLNKRINPSPRQIYRFGTKAGFYGEELLAPRQKHKIEYHPLSAVGVCFFQLFAAVRHIGGRSSNRNSRKRHVVVTKTHFSRYGQALGPKKKKKIFLTTEYLKLLSHL